MIDAQRQGLLEVLKPLFANGLNCFVEHTLARVWSEVVRSLPAPRIIVAATAFRDDFKLFAFDERHTHHYGFEEARRERCIRSLVLHPLDPIRNPATFTIRC